MAQNNLLPGGIGDRTADLLENGRGGRLVTQFNAKAIEHFHGQYPNVKEAPPLVVQENALDPDDGAEPEGQRIVERNGGIGEAVTALEDIGGGLSLSADGTEP
jgi:hypothetical protein